MTSGIGACGHGAARRSSLTESCAEPRPSRASSSPKPSPRVSYPAWWARLGRWRTRAPVQRRAGLTMEWGCLGALTQRSLAQGFDAFHELILIDEVCRCGSGGVVWGLVEGLQIGLPPVLHFGSAALKARVAPECLRGRKVICLCISEPYAGSDVAALRTTAVWDASGQHFVVNGEKKWITNGMFADYFTVAVRTGGEGNKGLSFLLLEKSMPGISCKQMDCSGVWASGTAFITFDNVRVPMENLIGTENEGFRYVMYNFNHEVRDVFARCWATVLTSACPLSAGASSCRRTASAACASRTPFATRRSAKPSARRCWSTP